MHLVVCIDFVCCSRLARIDIGGTKGKSLTNSVQQIHADFESTVAMFKTLQYDIMNVGRKEFDDDFYEFRCKIKNLEVPTARTRTHTRNVLPRAQGLPEPLCPCRCAFSQQHQEC